MSSLYNRYRPQSFAQIIGQNHIKEALVSALKNDKIGHAYLFFGPRGTGKTSTARLLAKAVNCAKKTNRPCNNCEICTLISQNRAVDIIEIDAASNRGIDEIRDLREKIAHVPTQLKFKVYIIDEVHMLTKEAFNALLKTLEEPPAHAIFILATTEIHKVPETIISRCQRFGFGRANAGALKEVLQMVAENEKISIEPSALELVSQRADGSFRDALTLLGNLSSHDGVLNEAAVREIIGLPQAESIKSCLELLRSGQTKELAFMINSYIQKGGDLTVFVKSLVDVCQEAIFSEDQTMPPEVAAPIMENLLLSMAQSRQSSDPTAFLLARLLKLSFGITTPLVKEAPAVSLPTAVTDLQKIEKAVAEDSAPVDSIAANPAPVKAGNSEEFWAKFLERTKQENHALYAILRSARPEQVTEDKFVVAVKFRFYSERLYEPKNRILLEKAAALVAGQPMRLEVQVKANLDLGGSNDEDLLATVVDVFELEEVA